MKIKFEYAEDELYFKNLLCSEGEYLEKYESLFDFRKPNIKRLEFNKISDKIKEDLIKKYGKICMLNYPNNCDLNTGFNVDHLIPLSSNKLNKMRGVKSEKGKKVRTQSFGSNNISNLIIACKKCNSHKKHIILEREQIQQILKSISKPAAQ